MKIIILSLLLIILCQSLNLQTHDYWFTKFKKSAQSGIPYADVAWNYCDLKCIYLESIVPNTDFYVVNFQDTLYKPNFSACYAVVSGGKPQLWNKAISNSFYERICGGDKEDYLANSKYKKIS